MMMRRTGRGVRVTDGWEKRGTEGVFGNRLDGACDCGR